MFKNFNWATYWAAFFAFASVLTLVFLVKKYGCTTSLYAVDATTGKPVGKPNGAIVTSWGAPKEFAAGTITS